MARRPTTEPNFCKTGKNLGGFDPLALALMIDPEIISMTDSLEHAKTIFLDALEIASPEARQRFLDKMCGIDASLRAEVEELLRFHEQIPSVSTPGAAAPTVELRGKTILPENASVRIGQYKLLQQIGEGGMGVVYMAEQTQPVQRRVALKLIKPGLDNRQVIARFEAERQALALMDHPNIAKVLDAGTTESGQPFFVMELVNGLSLTKFCDERRLTPRERLELFVPVCEAVQHAHQKGIIHRDLKPSNVVVAVYDGKPVPKVIDFGIAKATGSKLTDKTLFTEFGAVVGTLQYMSPEQVERDQVDIDTRSDIYSLGVMLYELLTGTTPIDKKRLTGAAILELMRLIKEEEPPKPSSRLGTTEELPSIAANRGLEPKRLSNLVRGELDWIAMKALEKDRKRRYESASAFGADLDRYLRDEPVTACPPSTRYRLTKFIRRNRTALTATTVVLIALVLGTVISVWQAIDASRARHLADERLALANERLASETAAKQEAERQRSIADEQRSLAEQSFQTALNSMHQTVANIADEKLGRVRKSEPFRKALLENALGFYEQFLALRSDDQKLQFEVAKAWQRIGLIKHLMNDWQGAVKAFDKVQGMAGRYLADSPDDARYLELIGECCTEYGLAVHYAGDGNRSLEIFEDGLKTFDRLKKLVPSQIAHQRSEAETQMLMTEWLKYSARDRAIVLLKHAIATQREILRQAGQESRDRSRLMWSLSLLAKIIANQDFDLAIQLLEEAESLGETLISEDQLDAPDGHHADPISALATVLAYRAEIELENNKGALIQQEERLRRALALLEPHRAMYPDGPSIRQYWAYITRAYADVLAAAGHTDEALLRYSAILKENLAEPAPGMTYTNGLCINGIEKLFSSASPRVQTEVVETIHQAFATLDERDRFKRRARMYFKSGRFKEALDDFSAAVERNADRLHILLWIPPAALVTCPDQGFLRSLLELADKTTNQLDGKIELYTARATLRLLLGKLSAAEQDFESALASSGINARQFNDSAWFFVASEQPKLHQAKGALLWAERAVELAPNEQCLWNTLGVARFRQSDWGGALQAIEKSMELGSEKFAAHDWYFLAMIHYQLGHPKEAQKWYDNAVEWTEKHAPQDEELIRFRAEGAELLGVSTTFDRPADALLPTGSEK